MISVKTINNQNAVINSVLGLDQNSNTIINGKLTIQDTSGSLVITPSGIIAPTNTVLNNLTVNGTSTYNGLSFLNSGGRVYNSTFMVAGTDLRVMDSGNVQGIQMFNSNVLGDNSTALQGIGANSKFSINTRDSTTQRNNFTAEYGNHIQIKGLTGGIDCLNDTVNLFSSTTTPTMTIAPTYPDNTTKIATTSFVSTAITNINPSITYPPTNSNTLNINNTISLTDGTTTNTLNQSDWTGTIKTVNTTANLTHYLNFSDSSGTGQGNPQKNINLSCNPFLSKITATTFEGIATISDTINLSSDNTSGTYFLPFSKTTNTTSGNKLFIDDITGPLSYDPSTSTLNCITFSGTANIANNVALTPANDNVTCYIPFSKTTSATSNQLFIDNTTTTLTYNPSFGTLSSTIMACSDIQLYNGSYAITSFSSGTLTINASNCTFRNFNWVLSGTTNSLTGLSITLPRINGVYNVGIYNGGSGNLTIGVALGVNIRTIYATPITVPTLGYALMTINVLSINSITMSCVDVNILNI